MFMSITYQSYVVLAEPKIKKLFTRLFIFINITHQFLFSLSWIWNKNIIY